MASDSDIKKRIHLNPSLIIVVFLGLVSIIALYMSSHMLPSTSNVAREMPAEPSQMPAESSPPAKPKFFKMSRTKPVERRMARKGGVRPFAAVAKSDEQKLPSLNKCCKGLDSPQSKLIVQCPPSHPYAYRPEAGFDHCCATASDCNGNAEKNKGPRAKRSDCCDRNDFRPCGVPPCDDYNVDTYEKTLSAAHEKTVCSGDGVKKLCGFVGLTSKPDALTGSLGELREEQIAAKHIEKLNLAFAVMLLNMDPVNQAYMQVLRKSLISVARPNSKYATGIAAFIAIIPDYLKYLEKCLYNSFGFDDVVAVPVVHPCPWRDTAHARMFTRLLLWNLTKYDRIVALDYDMVAIQNVDELFAFSVFSTVHEWPAGWIGHPCACRSRMCRGDFPDMELNLEWVQQGRYINAGIMVIQPNAKDFRRLAAALTEWNLKTEGEYSKDGCQVADQRFLGDYYTAQLGGEGWFPLPAEKYNVIYQLIKSVPQIVTEPKILHYRLTKPGDTLPDKSPMSIWYHQQWSKYASSVEFPICAANSPPPPEGASDLSELLGEMSEANRTRREKLCGPSMYRSREAALAAVKASPMWTR